MAYTAIDRVYSIFIDVMTGVSSGSGSATFYNTDSHTSYIELTVTNGNQSFDMTEYNYVLVVSKPSKQTYRNEYTTTDKSKLVIALDSQMLADSGSNKGQLYIMKTVDTVNKVLTMVEFNYIVKDGSYNELAPESTDHDALYIKLRNDVDSILNKIENGEIGGAGMTATQKEQLATAYNHAMSDAVTTADEVNSAVVAYVEANKDTLKGAKGDKGDKGEAGADGKDGLTTAISVNGSTYNHVNGTITLPNYPTVPTKTSELINDSKFATETYVTTKIAEASLGGGSVDLSEYAKTTEVNTAISTALDGHTFKFLTQAEYDALSDEEKNNETIVYNITDNDDTSALTSEEEVKLNAAYSHSQEVHAPANAEANVQADWNETDETSDAYIKNKPTSMGWDGILTSTGGRKFMLAVSDDGVLSAVEIVNYANIVVSSGTLSMKEGTTATFTVALDSQPDRTQTVSLVSNNSFVTVSPETLTFTTDNYATAQTVTITATEDKSEYSGFNATVTLTSGTKISATVNIAVANVTGTANGDVVIGDIVLPDYYLILELESSEDSTVTLSDNGSGISIDLYTMEDKFVNSYTGTYVYTVPQASTRYKAIITNMSASNTRINYYLQNSPSIIKVNGIIPSTIIAATRFLHGDSKLEYINLNINNSEAVNSGQFINACTSLKELHLTNLPSSMNSLMNSFISISTKVLEVVDEETWWKSNIHYTDYYFCCLSKPKLLENYPDIPKSWGGSNSILPTDVKLLINGVGEEVTEYTTGADFRLYPLTTPLFADLGTFTIESGADVLSINQSTDSNNGWKFGNVTLNTSGDAVVTYTVNGISKTITIHSTKA